MKRLIFGLLIFMAVLLYPVETESLGVTIDNEEMKNDLLTLKKKLLLEKIDTKLENFYLGLQGKHSYEYVVNFIDKLTCKAINSEALPSIIIAQAALETGYGKYNKLGNNIFGIKGRGIKTKTKEWHRDRFIIIYDQFQYFPTLDAAINRHYQIINRYDFKTRDYIEWATKIYLGGYATDPNYAKKLIYIIDRYNLTELDQVQELHTQYEKL
jgi:flagellum-specific peptidoglycan hydrolase FlgJ